MQEAFKFNNFYLEALFWPYKTIFKKKITFLFETKLVQIGPKTTVREEEEGVRTEEYPCVKTLDSLETKKVLNLKFIVI